MKAALRVVGCTVSAVPPSSVHVRMPKLKEGVWEGKGHGGGGGKAQRAHATLPGQNRACAWLRLFLSVKMGKLGLLVVLLLLSAAAFPGACLGWANPTLHAHRQSGSAWHKQQHALRTCRPLPEGG